MLAWKADDLQMIVGGSSGGSVFGRLINLKKQKIEANLSALTRTVWGADWTNEGAMVLGGEDNDIRWYEASAKFLKSNNAHKGFINCLSSSPSRAKILSVSTDQSFKIFDAKGTLLIEKKEAHGKGIMCGGWLDENTHFTCSNDQTIKLWKEGELIRSWKVESSTYQINDFQTAVALLKNKDEQSFLCSVSLCGAIKIFSVS